MQGICVVDKRDLLSAPLVCFSTVVVYRLSPFHFMDNFTRHILHFDLIGCGFRPECKGSCLNTRALEVLVLDVELCRCGADVR